MIVNNFEKIKADKDHNCFYCEELIKEGHTYYKQSEANRWVRLHQFCYSALLMRSVEIIGHKLRDLHDV